MVMIKRKKRPELKRHEPRHTERSSITTSQLYGKTQYGLYGNTGIVSSIPSPGCNSTGSYSHGCHNKINASNLRSDGTVTKSLLDGITSTIQFSEENATRKIQSGLSKRNF